MPNPAHTLVSAYHKRRSIRSHWLYHLLWTPSEDVACQYRHIARLTRGTPAHNTVHCQVGLAPGRARWTNQLRNDTGSVPANLWRQAILRAMVERRDGPSWLRDDDDDDDELRLLLGLTQHVRSDATGTPRKLGWNRSVVTQEHKNLQYLRNGAR